MGGIDAVKLRVGEAKGLPRELAERLQGDTEAEVEADAERIAAVIPGP